MAAAVPQSGAADALPTDRDALWQLVSAQPKHFVAWEALIRVVSAPPNGLDPAKGANADDIQYVKAVFDTFFAHFPLCFGYWKMYADLTKTMGNPQEVLQIYERAVQAIPNSVDLWTAYGEAMMNYSAEDVAAVRSVFQRGADGCGMDFLAHPFWDRYMAFEQGQGVIAQNDLEKAEAESNVFSILLRIIHIPLHQYARYYERYV